MPESMGIRLLEWHGTAMNVCCSVCCEARYETRAECMCMYVVSE